jgi:hypothetical protein
VGAVLIVFNHGDTILYGEVSPLIKIILAKKLLFELIFGIHTF